MRALVLAAAIVLGTATGDAAPAVHVRIASVTDAAERASHVELVKRSLAALDAHAIDVVVSRLVVADSGAVSAKIDVVLSSAGGMRSIASGTAAFRAPRHRLRDAGALRREALGHALEALHRRVRALRPAT